MRGVRQQHTVEFLTDLYCLLYPVSEPKLFLLSPLLSSQAWNWSLWTNDSGISSCIFVHLNANRFSFYHCLWVPCPQITPTTLICPLDGDFFTSQSRREFQWLEIFLVILTRYVKMIDCRRKRMHPKGIMSEWNLGQCHDFLGKVKKVEDVRTAFSHSLGFILLSHLC